MVDRWVAISMVVMCDDIVFIENDRKRRMLSSAPLDVEHGNNSTEH